MENSETKNLYEGYTDHLYTLDPRQTLKFGCYDLTICRKCLHLYGRVVQQFIDPAAGVNKSLWLYQKCRCMEDEEKANGKIISPWWGFDYNKAVEFCYCCSGELINCGLKFSWFYCTDCKEMVEDHDRKPL